MTRAEQILPSPRADPYGDPGPSAAIPALRCWRCGADCTAAHRTIHDLGRDMHVCAGGCVPTLVKEIR